MPLTPVLLNLLQRAFENLTAKSSGRFHVTTECFEHGVEDEDERSVSDSSFEWSSGTIATINEGRDHGQPLCLETRAFLDDGVVYYRSLNPEDAGPTGEPPLWAKMPMSAETIRGLRDSVTDQAKQMGKFLALMSNPDLACSTEPAPAGRLAVRATGPAAAIKRPNPRPGEVAPSEDFKVDIRLEVDLEHEVPVSMDVESGSSALELSYKLRCVFYSLGRPLDIVRPDPAECEDDIPPVPGHVGDIETTPDPDYRELRISIEGATALVRVETQDLDGEPAVGERVLVSGAWVDLEPDETPAGAPFTLATMLALDGSSYYDFDPSCDQRDQEGRLQNRVSCSAVFEGSSEARGHTWLSLDLDDGTPCAGLTLDWWRPLPEEGAAVTVERRWARAGQGEPFANRVTGPDGKVVASMSYLYAISH